VDRDLISAAVRQLKAQHAMKLTKGIGASGNFGTTPVAPSFVIVAHTDTERDWRDMETFRPVEEYGSGGRISDDEIGKVEECRIILSPQLIPFAGAGSATTNGMKATGSNVDVYPILVFGEEAYGTVKVAGMDGINMKVKNPGKEVTYEDPLGQRGFVSWKTYFTVKILNDNYMVRIEAGVTDL
jgi:N4-gp56 family major capsid protein